MNSALITRDVRLALRSGGAWLLGIAFFAVFMAMSVIALGGDTTLLKRFSPSLIWLAFLLSALLSYGQIFESDYTDGTLAQTFILTGRPFVLVTSKAVSFALTALAPLLLAIPIAGIMMGLTFTTLGPLLLSLLLAIPAICAYGTFASALTVTRGASGFLIVLITAPFLIPVLIFGISAVEGYQMDGLSAPSFKALLGLSLIGLSVGLPATVAALKTIFD